MKPTFEIEKKYYQIQVWYAEKWIVANAEFGCNANFNTPEEAFEKKALWVEKYPGKKFKVVKVTEELVG